MAAADGRLRGIDQVVHTWLAPGVVVPHPFVDVADDEWADGCEHSLAAAWWVARASAAPLRASSGSLVFLVPTVGMAGAADFTMLAAVAEGIRVLAKGCGRQWGVDGATVNTIAAAPHHWLDPDTAEGLTRAISLSTPALGSAGSVSDDLAPLIALLEDPDAHFLTAATLVADGGTWVGL
jgi:3-oxoacyl-[acyl-carrier protein] reductase